MKIMEREKKETHLRRVLKLQLGMNVLWMGGKLSSLPMNQSNLSMM